MWIVLVFWFGIYALIIKIIVWIYERFFEKKSKNENIRWQDCIEFKTDILPIAIENQYLLKSVVTTKIFLLSFFIIGWYLAAIPDFPQGSSKALSQYFAIKTTQVGVIFAILFRYKMLWFLVKNKLFIIIDKEKITYEYIDTRGNKKDYKLLLHRIIKAEWSYIPIFGEHDKIKHKTNFDFIFALMPRLVLNFIFIFIFYFLKFFQIKKYWIISDNNIIIAVPKKNIYFCKKVSFSRTTILNSLIIQNSNLLKG